MIGYQKEKREQETENLFELIRTENFPNLEKEVTWNPIKSILHTYDIYIWEKMLTIYLMLP